MSPFSCLAIPFQSLAVKFDIVYMDLQRLVTITVNELTNIQILSKKRGQSRNDNAGISGHPEESTPGHPGAFVTAAVTMLKPLG